MTLQGDLEVTLFEHANFAGKPLQLPGAGFQPKKNASFNLLTYQFGQRASSLIVRARGDAPVQMKPPVQPPPPPARSEAPSTGAPHRAPGAPPAITPKTATVIKAGAAIEPNTNRPGRDYRHFDLDDPQPAHCQAACQEDGKCRAWTYVKPVVQGPLARCWLKSGVPPAEPAPCCVSGVK